MTERQAKILAAIVEQYAEVASPVGSVTLAKLFNVSSATIRAEMAQLEAMGYVTHPHTSAGRIPTDKGYRYYVNQLQSANEEDATIDRGARAIDVRITSAGEPRQAIQSAVSSLSEITRNLGFATIGSQLYMSGLAYLFTQPEFNRTSSVKAVAALLDNLEPWLRETAPNKPLSVYIGRENPIGKSSGCSLIISRFQSPFSSRSYVGVLGPTRQSYRSVMNLVRHAGKILEEELWV
ncbi:transcriptional regulator [Candidatus Saccharibacteria bacterium CPR2]|nr:transcriptional regulator [Candidatus Saccharibacteria bacterium CPR2]